jgi:hypothetical protein
MICSLAAALASPSVLAPKSRPSLPVQLCAMPECAIGLHPDVGASWFLNHRSRVLKESAIGETGPPALPALDPTQYSHQCEHGITAACMWLSACSLSYRFLLSFFNFNLGGRHVSVLRGRLCSQLPPL